jgi:pseudaminic acid cytidylyltransferase
MNIAIVPARGGSQRIPKKNIFEFCGNPMIAYSIETALSSDNIEKVIVSTDIEEIAEIARRYGAEVPFLRPANLSDHHTPTAPVIAHAVEEMKNSGDDVKYACCIYPCTPLLTTECLDEIYQKMLDGDHMFSYPVVRYSHPIQRAMRIASNGKMSLFQPEHELTRTQDLEPAYHDAGQFYWGKADAWLSGKKMHTDGIGVPISSRTVVDIDHIDDIERAELIKKSLMDGSHQS